jgi:hypothetical protein
MPKNISHSACSVAFWWPFLLGPAIMGFNYFAEAQGLSWYLSKPTHEVAAVCLTSIALLCHAVRWRTGHNPVHQWLTFLALAFLCREIHFAGTGKGVYIALIVLLIWGWRSRKQLLEGAAVGRLGQWVLATGWTYFLSQFIARRIFRYLYLPNEDGMHIMLEEAVENMAHIMLIITAFADRFGKERDNTPATSQAPPES